MKKLLHVGCGNIRPSGFINTDKAEMDISKSWPHGDESVDGIVSMQVLQCLTWKELMVALGEAYRVLKWGGVMRMGVNLVETGYPLEKVLYGANINLFSFSLLENILKRVGFKEVGLCEYRESIMPELASLDSRFSRGSSYIEALKE